jgi:hypothetical protein
MPYHYLNNTDISGGGGGGALGVATVWATAANITFPTTSLRDGDIFSADSLGFTGSSGTFRYDLASTTWFLIYGVFATEADMTSFTTDADNNIAEDAILIVGSELDGGLIS